MTAKEKFKLGDRVQMTPDAREKFPSNAGVGVVVGFGVQYETGVWILGEGHRPSSRQRWHMDFWEVTK